MTPISAVCTLTTSFANTFTSTSWPAPFVAKRSFTISRAPSWCWIISSRNARSNAGPCAASIRSSCAWVSIPGIVMLRHDDVSGANCWFDRSQSCMIRISDTCDWSIFVASRSNRALALCRSAMRDM